MIGFDLSESHVDPAARAEDARNDGSISSSAALMATGKRPNSRPMTNILRINELNHFIPSAACLHAFRHKRGICDRDLQGTHVEIPVLIARRILVTALCVCPVEPRVGVRLAMYRLRSSSGTRRPQCRPGLSKMKIRRIKIGKLLQCAPIQYLHLLRTDPDQMLLAQALKRTVDVA